MGGNVWAWTEDGISLAARMTTMNVGMIHRKKIRMTNDIKISIVNLRIMMFESPPKCFRAEKIVLSAFFNSRSDNYLKMSCNFEN
jgi:hypothetical protein